MSHGTKNNGKIPTLVFKGYRALKIQFEQYKPTISRW